MHTTAYEVQVSVQGSLIKKTPFHAHSFGSDLQGVAPGLGKQAAACPGPSHRNTKESKTQPVMLLQCKGVGAHGSKKQDDTVWELCFGAERRLEWCFYMAAILIPS